MALRSRKMRTPSGPEGSSGKHYILGAEGSRPQDMERQ